MKTLKWTLLTVVLAAAAPGFGQAQGNGPAPHVECRVIEINHGPKFYTLGTIDGRSRLLDSVGVFNLNVDMTGRVVEKSGDGIRIQGEYTERNEQDYGHTGNGICYGTAYDDTRTDVLNIPDAQLRDWGYAYTTVERDGKTVDGLVSGGKTITGRDNILRELVKQSRIFVSARESRERSRKARTLLQKILLP